MSISYKNLYTQVNNLIDARIKYNGALPYKSQQAHKDIAPFSLQSSSGNVSANELIGAVMQILTDVVPSRILNGLEVEATNPISDNIIVRAGKGTAGGNVYELLEDTTCNVSLNQPTYVFYVNLYPSRIVIENIQSELTVAKIIVPRPGITTVIQDTNDGSWNAYIQSFKEYRLFGFNDKFEEDTQALLRDNIGDILADNLIGNIRLNENLKIINTSGTLQLDSTQLLLKDFNGHTLSKLNNEGVYFYDASGAELAKFTTTGARIGNIVVTTKTVESKNFLTGVSGFKLYDHGDAEFNDIIVRGTVYANAGVIGGWTIGNNELYATTTGTIKTGVNVGSGQNGCIFDKDGMRMYDSILGLVANFPSDGTKPTISAGTIGGVTFEISTNTVLRTSDTVGDGSADSYGILINNTGMYGCTANQLLADANFKVLANGDAYFKGTITATNGQIGSVTITPTSLTGGLIQGAEIVSPIIETSLSLPRIRLDENGMYYQVTSNIGQYDTFKYGDGTKYGVGVLSYLFNAMYPPFSVVAEGEMADVRLYNRSADPGSGTGPHVLGDLIIVNGALKVCSSAGSPGVFSSVGTTTFLGLTDTPSSYSGQATKYLKVNAGETALEFSTITINTSLIRDTDNDTKVETEKNADEDKIRFTTDGVERGVIDASGYTGAIVGSVTGNVTGNITGNITGNVTGDEIITAAPSSDHTASGIKIVLTANEYQAFGDVCFINAEGQAQLIDADAIATMSAVVMCCSDSVNADASGNYLVLGIARDDSWAWTVGGLIYGTVTASSGNTLSQTAPTGTDDVIQIMGVATHADRMLFKPSLVQVEHL